jgi:hypothetical protein
MYLPVLSPRNLLMMGQTSMSTEDEASQCLNCPSNQWPMVSNSPTSGPIELELLEHKLAVPVGSPRATAPRG